MLNFKIVLKDIICFSRDNKIFLKEQFLDQDTDKKIPTQLNNYFSSIETKGHRLKKGQKHNREPKSFNSIDYIKS